MLIITRHKIRDDRMTVDTVSKSSDIALLDGLIAQAGLYRTSKQFIELLDFVTRLGNFAPFNAMILHIQKPGLRFAASEADWHERFERSVKFDARPLLIMWPFCPVALVYDIEDTTGSDLPEDVAKAFRTHGEMTEERILKFIELLKRKNIKTTRHSYGDGQAGSIQLDEQVKDKKGKELKIYSISINKNHDLPTQFSTLSHELGHLLLGHLGSDKRLKTPCRRDLTLQQKEVEAESVAYLVCKRNGLEPDSDKYLSQFQTNESIPKMEVYQIMRAAGQIEQLLGLGSKTQFDKQDKESGKTSVPPRICESTNLHASLVWVPEKSSWEAPLDN